jgi:hypothetical protein
MGIYIIGPSSQLILPLPRPTLALVRLYDLQRKQSNLLAIVTATGNPKSSSL